MSDSDFSDNSDADDFDDSDEDFDADGDEDFDADSDEDFDASNGGCAKNSSRGKRVGKHKSVPIKGKRKSVSIKGKRKSVPIEPKEATNATMPSRKRPSPAAASSPPQSKAAKVAANAKELMVALTGARKGDVLIGVSGKKDSENVQLEVAEGIVHVLDAHNDGLTADQLARLYMKDRNVSRAIAENMVKGRPRRIGSIDNVLPMGSGCPTFSGEHGPAGSCGCEPSARFIVQQPGVWADFAEDAGFGLELAKIVSERRVVNWRDILRLMGKKLLILRSILFKVSVGPRLVSDSPEQSSRAATRIDARFTEGAGVTFEICGRQSRVFHITVDGSDGGQLPDHHDMDAVKQIVSETLRGVTEEEAQLAHQSLVDKTAGELKSALQKVVRFGCQSVAVLDGQATVSSDAYAATAATVLALGPGSFVPDLQKFIRGPEAAFKRAGVILVEDAWAGTPKDVERLLGLALVCQVVPTHSPPLIAVRTCARLMGEAVHSRKIIAWRESSPATSKDVGLASGRLQSPDGNFGRCAMLLDQIGSFGGDKAMMHEAARLEKKAQWLPVWVYPAGTMSRTMPEHHIYDQHVARGIGHVLGEAGGLKNLDTFAKRFRAVFVGVTGTNPRLGTVPPEDRPDVAAVRKAQRIHMVLSTTGTGRPHDLLSPDARPENLDAEGETGISLPLDPGVLAAGVGPVAVEVKLGKRRKLALFVLLGTQRPEEETVMLRPGREAIRALYSWGDTDDEDELALVEEERQLARNAARQREGGLPVRSTFLGSGGRQHRATFCDGIWHLDGLPWERVVCEGLQRTVPVFGPPFWAIRAANLGPDLLRDEAALLEALRARGIGVVRGADVLVKGLCASLPAPVVSRAFALMRQQHNTVAMPVPGLDGASLGSDQLQAFDGDWLVWRLLVLLGRLVPGSLQAITPPRFHVADAGLLQLLLGWVAEAVNSSPVISTAGDLARLIDMAKTLGPELRPHQRDAVNDMCARDDRGVPGHFVVMETGMGKTLTALQFFAHQLAALDSYRQRVEYWIWVTPPGKKMNNGLFTLIESLGKQLRHWRAPYIVVQPPKGRARANFRRGIINVVAHDHLRKMLPDLLRVGPRSVVVFDEVDELYNATKRTSAALLLASSCWRFVAMTATPMTKTVDRLATWLGLTQNYPVTSHNYLVAASEMVAAQITLGIERKYEDYFVPQTDAARSAFATYLRSGGRGWADLARAVQSETDDPMCDTAADLAHRDRQKHSDGGVLLVADSAEHVSRLVRCLSKKGVIAGGAERMEEGTVAVVVVAKTNARGYNGAIRLGALVRGVYAGNGAQRHQMEGRICRIGQRRRRLVYATVVMEHTMLHLLYDRQQTADAINMSLQQFALKYEAEVLALESK